MNYLDPKNNKPNLEFELKTHNENNSNFFIGVDEVGRGSWAGPIVACACWINPKEFENLPVNIKDSKKLSHKNKNKIFEESQKICLASTAVSSSYEIDKFGLTISNNLAIRRSLHSLLNTLNFKYHQSDKKFSIYLDGNVIPDFNTINKVRTTLPELPNHKITTIVKGDDKIVSISLASIIAKVTRDLLMKNYDKMFPIYDFKNNVGYGTKHHRKIIESKGICKIHRKSFKPINTIFI